MINKRRGKFDGHRLIYIWKLAEADVSQQAHMGATVVKVDDTRGKGNKSAEDYRDIWKLSRALGSFRRIWSWKLPLMEAM